nr:MAG TPA: hypothetical protein [Caudoviricetes sp.]
MPHTPLRCLRPAGADLDGETEGDKLWEKEHCRTAL